MDLAEEVHKDLLLQLARLLIYEKLLHMIQI